MPACHFLGAAQAQIGPDEFRMPSYCLPWSHGLIAHQLGRGRARLEERTLLDDPAVAMGGDVSRADHALGRVALGSLDGHRVLAHAPQAHGLADLRLRQRLPECALEVHPPDGALAAPGLDFGEVGQGRPPPEVARQVLAPASPGEAAVATAGSGVTAFVFRD